MKTIIAALLFSVGSVHAAGIVKNLGSDPYPAGGDQPVSCNLYLSGVLVINAPVVPSGANVACKFVGVTLLPNQSYTATGVDATGFESAPSVPFVTSAGPSAPTNLRVVP